MKRYFLLLMLCNILITTLKSQSATTGKIKGTIKVENNEIAENATVSLLTAKDSLLIKTTLPDKDGVFEFENIKEGNYLISVSLLGYAKHFSNNFSINKNKQQEHLATIVLTKSSQNLADVKVESKKPFIERKLDRMIVNVENSIVSAGSNVINILERSPGVFVNDENGINLKGKQGVVIMIDGKPSPLAGADLINYLKTIQSSNVATVEIITNPSSKYDAAGNAGIINIKLKKDIRQGVNGNYTASLGHGVYIKPTISSNLNYRNKKLNLFGNYSNSQPTQFTQFNITRKFFDVSGATQNIFNQSSFIKNPVKAQNVKFGVDVYTTKKTIIGVVFNFNFQNSIRDGNTNSIVTNPNGSLLYTSKTNIDYTGKNNNGFGNFNFKHIFDSSGKELTIDADYGKYSSAANQNYYNQYYDAATQPTTNDKFKTNQEGIITVQSFKADYVQPLKETAKIEAGIKLSLVKTDNDLKFYTINGTTINIDTTRTNHFIYKENVNAAYINFSKEYKKFDIQIGLRLENTITNGKQISTGEIFSRNYTQLFPSVFVNDKINEDNQLSFSYSRRIDRPTYRQLNPFKIFTDPYTYVVGEPALLPVSTHIFELNHTLKGKYITSFSYTKSTSSITDVFTQDDVSKISYQSPANIQDFEQYNLGVSIPVTIKKWMNSNVSASVYYNQYSSPFQGGQLNNKFTSWDINNTNNFIIGKKGWVAELSAYYQSKNVWGLFLIKNLAQVSAGIQKTTNDKKSTFKLSVSDIFCTNRIAVVVAYQNMDFFTNRTWDSRVATLSFTHRFGKNTVARARQRVSGIEDEKKRANS